MIEDVAVCVEVKGRTIAEPARRGDRARLGTEIKAIFGQGARQARRTEQLISQNHGLWLRTAPGLTWPESARCGQWSLALTSSARSLWGLAASARWACWEKAACPGSPHCTT